MSCQCRSGNAEGSDEALCDMNTTPLIDVMLVLLVMLIVTIPIQTHAVKLDLPQNNNAPPPNDQQPVVINLEIDFDGTPIWNGTPVTSRARSWTATSQTSLVRSRSRKCICGPTASLSTMRWPARSPTRRSSG